MLRPTPTQAPAIAVAFLLAALAVAPAASAETLLNDDFESSSLSAWSSVQTSAGGSAFVQGQVVHSGARAARLWATATAGSHGYMRKLLPTAPRELTIAGDLRVLAGGTSGNVPLLRLYDPSGTRLISLYRQNQDSDKLYVHHSGQIALTSGVLALNTWGRFELTVRTQGDLSTIVVKLNGDSIYQTTTASMGAVGVESVQLGNNTAAQPFDLAADNITITTPDAGGAAPPPTGCVASTPAPVTNDPGTVVVAENFETDLWQWSVAQTGDAGVATQSSVVRSGGCAARVVVSASDSSLANMTRQLPTGTREVWSDGWFNFEAEGVSTNWNVPTFRYFSDGKRVLDVSRPNGNGRLFVRYPNGSGGWTILSTGQYTALGRWYHIKIHAIANGSASTVEVWLDGHRIFSTTAATFAAWRLSTLMLYAEHAGQQGVLAIDDVVVKATG